MGQTMIQIVGYTDNSGVVLPAEDELMWEDGEFRFDAETVNKPCSVFSLAIENGTFRVNERTTITNNKTDSEQTVEATLTYMAQPTPLTYVEELKFEENYVYMQVFSSGDLLTPLIINDFISQVYFKKNNDEEKEKNDQFEANDKYFYIQSALLYSYGDGTRRIRVHNLCVPLCTNINTIYEAVNSECLASFYLKETIDRNGGMANPEGYRKALRLAKQAEKFGRPIITFIDTQGAYPGLGSEERGIGQAIAVNLREFSQLKTPVICIVIGEGGSGGALGIGIGDKIYMLENAIYSVISPEGCASILLRDSSKAKDAAAMLRITSRDILSMKVANGVIAEPKKGAHTNPSETAAAIKNQIKKD